MKYVIKSIAFGLLFSFVIICIASCKHHKAKVYVTNMVGREFLFPDSLLCFNSGKFEDFEQSLNKPSIIFWLDSSDCTKCNIDRLLEYNSLIMSFEDSLLIDISFYPIVSTSSQNRKSNINEDDLQNLSFPVFIDRTNSFNCMNSFIPDDKRYHFFLLDDFNIIKLVGDPLYSASLINLYLKTIQSMQNN